LKTVLNSELRGKGGKKKTGGFICNWEDKGGEIEKEKGKKIFAQRAPVFKGGEKRTFDRKRGAVTLGKGGEKKERDV